MMEDRSHLIKPVSILVVITALASASGGDRRMFDLGWESGVTSPGVCIKRTDWILAVIPESAATETKQGPSVKTSEETLATEILYFDPIQRLCLLQTEHKIDEASPSNVATTPEPHPGDKLTCSSPDAKCRTTVAGKEWTYRGRRFQLPLMRVRLANPDKSGCSPGTPLFNDDGELEGLLTEHRLEGKGEALAIPASRIHKLVCDVEKYHRSGPVWLGLIFHNHSSSPEVIEVKPNSPASKAGIQKGDVILSLNGKHVEDLNELSEAVLCLPAGEPATIEVLRGLMDEELSLVPQFASVSDSETSPN